MIFKITDDKKFIEIECMGSKGATFQEFKDKLPESDCRYAVLDVEINTKSGATANKLIFIAWCASCFHVECGHIPCNKLVVCASDITTTCVSRGFVVSAHLPRFNCEERPHAAPVCVSDGRLMFVCMTSFEFSNPCG